MKSKSSVWESRIDDQTIASVLKRLLETKKISKNHTWLVVYDLNLYRDRLNYLKSSFGRNALHTLAIKSCPLISILKEAVKTGFGLEAASIEEVHLALKSGCPKEKIIFDSPIKTKDELLFSLENGIHINVDNFEELRIISELRPENSASNVGLRINPKVGEGFIAMTSVAGGNSKFGIPIFGNENKIFSAFSSYEWLNGLHVHVGSQGCDLDLLVSAVKVIDNLKSEINRTTGEGKISWIDIGGGLPADYGFEVEAIDVNIYVDQLKKRVPGIFQQKIITEFGRSILANCAWAVSRIGYVKGNGSGNTCSVHFGADFLMRPVYDPEHWKHQYLVFNQFGERSDAKHVSLDIAGPLCFAGDYVDKGNEYPKPTLEDFIVAKDVGAYTLSMWSRHCNRRLPPVIGYKGEISEMEFICLYQGETIQDVVDFWT